MQWIVKNASVHVEYEDEPEAGLGWIGTRMTRSLSDSDLLPLTGGKIIREPRDQSTRLPLEASMTTAMLDIGKHMSLQELITLLDKSGLNGAYDFVYIPGGFQKKGGGKKNRALPHPPCSGEAIGYAVVNFVAAKDLQRARLVLTLGCSAFRLQGLEALMARYQDSALMHRRRVEAKFKPVLFKEGRRTTFPAPAANGKGRGQRRLTAPCSAAEKGRHPSEGDSRVSPSAFC